MHHDGAVTEDARVRNRAGDDTRLNDTITQLIQQGRDREAAELGSARTAQPPRGAQMDPRDQLDAIVPLLNDLVADLDTSQLGASTPCASFDVRQVLEHMIGGGTAFAAAFRGEAAGEAPSTDDILGAFQSAMAELQAAMRSPGALERTIAAPFGEVPGETFARFVALDGLVHGWDIATATGQTYDPPAEVVREADAFARQAIGDDMRDGDTFAAATVAPPGAAPIVHLVAFTGRSV